MSPSPPTPTPAVKPKAATAATSPPPKRKGGWLLLLAGSGLCLACSVVVAFVAFPNPPTSHAPAAPDPDLATAVVEAPQLLVNLAGAVGRRTLKATIAFEIECGDAAAGAEEFKKHLPWIQDILIDLLSSKAVEEVEGAQTKSALRAAIREEVNRRLAEETKGKKGEAGAAPKVTRVYLREFVLS